MLQQPLARRVAGAARYAAAGEALPGALPLSSMRRRARGLRAAAVPTDGTTTVVGMVGKMAPLKPKTLEPSEPPRPPKPPKLQTRGHQ